jgi:ketosteroid isomerase-like protein
MSEHRNVSRLRSGYEAMGQGDLPKVLDLFATDGVMHIGAEGPYSGAHRGHDAIGEALVGLFEWTGGTMKFSVEDIFADDDHAVAVIRETAQRASDGLTLDVRESHLFRLVDGLATEFWDLPADADRDAHDAFFT